MGRMMTDKVVLVLINKGRDFRQTKLSTIKKGDTFLDFPHLRTSAMPEGDLRKRWAKATADAQVYSSERPNGGEWGVEGRYLTEEEGLQLPQSCGGYRLERRPTAAEIETALGDSDGE